MNLHVSTEGRQSEALARRINALEAQVFNLKRAAQIDKSARLISAFGLSPAQARLMAMLSDGKVRTSAQLLAGMCFDRDGDAPRLNTLNVQMYRLRVFMWPYGVIVKTVVGAGFELQDANGVVAQVLRGEPLPIVAWPDPALSDGRATSWVQLERIVRTKASADGYCSLVNSIIPLNFRLRRPISVILDQLQKTGRLEIVKMGLDMGSSSPWIVKLAPECGMSAQ